MKTYNQLIEDTLPHIREIFPWDMQEKIDDKLLVVDIREPHEYQAMHIEGSINAPRGILEQCSEWDYEETIPELVQARERNVVVVCRSGNRSVLAAYTLQQLGFRHVYSLKTGLRGWNDYELPLVGPDDRPVDTGTADEYFTSRVKPEQLRPQDN